MEDKFTTEALKPNEYLVCVGWNMFESWMEGYRNGKRAKDLDGYYINRECINMKLLRPSGAATE